MPLSYASVVWYNGGEANWREAVPERAMENKRNSTPGDKIARELPRFGKNLSRALRDGLDTGDFGRMGREIELNARDFAGQVQKIFGEQQINPAPRAETKEEPAPEARYVPARRSPFRSRMPGSVSGVVWAAAGLLLGTPLALVGFCALAVNVAAAAAALLPLAGALFAAAAVGFALRRRARRFARYREVIGGASFSRLEEIAASTGQTEARTKKDLRKMITTGACPQGHFDDAETCFIVDDATYTEYLDAQRAYEARRKAESAAAEQNRSDPQKAALEAAEGEGKDYLRRIREANDELPGEEISAKLDRLENVTGRIFRCVEQHPEKLPELRRFIRYYMPTTLQLVQKYQEFEAQPVRGENIVKAQKEIEQALDTVNTAFENLLDTLYADDAINVSADISALEGMLKQEGLTGSDFSGRTGNNDAKKSGGNV